MKRHIQWFLLSLLFVARLNASHILGGEIYYDDLGSGNYRVTLKVYRDCLNGQVDFDGLLNFNNTIIDPTLTIFDGSGNYVMQVLLDPPVVNYIPPSINNPCISTPNSVCMEEGVYTKTISLPPQAGGYYIVYQRCCRSVATLNVVNPTSLGATIYEHIPGPEVVAVNSSPRFKQLPPIYICNGMQIGFDHSAIDPDGDILVYSLCAPFTGLNNCCGHVPMGAANPTTTPCDPSCPPFNKPPFSALPFVSPYSGAYPLASSPAININPSTGLLNGIPNINGQWAVGVQVLEYRNNVLIGTHYRDYMFSVVPCIYSVESVIKPQDILCSGSTITFTNLGSGASTWHWDFGVNGIQSDTSILQNPSYTFPDTGKYHVTLIASPSKPCADTAYEDVYVYPPLLPTFTAPGAQCITSNNFSFHVGGAYASYSTFNWNFGNNASPSSASSASVTGVVYNQPGKFPVTVIVQERVCADTLTDTAKVYPKPVVKFDSTSYSCCAGGVLTFSNIIPSGYPTSYNWSFSNGIVSTVKNPTVSFYPAGVYNVTITAVTNNGCIDTSKVILPGFVTANPAPVAAFSFSPTETSIFDPDIYFFDESQGGATWNYDFGDGTSSAVANPLHTYQTYGDFLVTQTVINSFGCIDTTSHLVKILPEFRYWVPNSFTPNKDGLNDLFTPVTYGVEEYNFSIYDRWGTCIFKTDVPNTGWDGIYQNAPCQQDVYAYMITFKNVVTQRDEWHYGHVNLIR